MTAFADQVTALGVLSNSIEEYTEGGVRYLLLKDAALPKGCTPARVDMLVRLGGNGDGYDSKLLFAERVTSDRASPAPNWQTQSRIIERNWHWYSWKAEQAETLDLLPRVLVHMRALGP